MIFHGIPTVNQIFLPRYSWRNIVFYGCLDLIKCSLIDMYLH